MISLLIMYRYSIYNYLLSGGKNSTGLMLVGSFATSGRIKDRTIVLKGKGDKEEESIRRYFNFALLR